MADQEKIEKKKRKVKKQKKSKSMSISSIPKWVLWSSIGITIVCAEVAISYVVVTQIFNKDIMDTSAEISSEDSEKQTSEDSVNAAEKLPVKTDSSERNQLDVKKQTQKTSVSQKLSNNEEINNNESKIDFSKIKGIFTIPDFVVNPSDSQGKHFIVLTVILAFEDKKLIEKMAKVEPFVKDRMLTILGKRTFEWYGNNENREIVRRDILNLTYNILDRTSGIQIFFNKYVLQ